MALVIMRSFSAATIVNRYNYSLMAFIGVFHLCLRRIYKIRYATESILLLVRILISYFNSSVVPENGAYALTRGERRYATMCCHGVIGNYGWAWQKSAAPFYCIMFSHSSTACIMPIRRDILGAIINNEWLKKAVIERLAACKIKSVSKFIDLICKRISTYLYCYFHTACEARGMPSRGYTLRKIDTGAFRLRWRRAPEICRLSPAADDGADRQYYN